MQQAGGGYVDQAGADDGDPLVNETIHKQVPYTVTRMQTEVVRRQIRTR